MWLNLKADLRDIVENSNLIQSQITRILLSFISHIFLKYAQVPKPKKYKQEKV